MAKTPPIPSIQTAQALGRPVTHDDIHNMPIRAFFRGVATRSRGWAAPQGEGGQAVNARLDAGRWLADCPYCDGAELVTPADPIFFCLSCGSKGTYHPVVFPGTMDSIGREVQKRGNPMTWAWQPGETLTDLRKETALLAQLDQQGA